MHLAKYYNEKKMMAFVIVPGIDNPGQLELELNLLSEHLGQPVPMIFEIRRLAEGEWWGHSVIKFMLHPSIPFEQGDWVKLNKENAKSIVVEEYQLGKESPWEPLRRRNLTTPNGKR